jgi:hypothetical protein
MFYKVGAWVAASLVFLLPTMAFGQGAGSGPEPRLPGAVTTAPAWLKGAPFDVAAFFEMPPPSQNAAPRSPNAFDAVLGRERIEPSPGEQ